MLRLTTLFIVALAQAAAQVYTSSPAPVKGQSSATTGAAVPTTADLTGVVSSGNLTGLVACDSSALLSMTTATTTQIVALQAVPGWVSAEYGPGPGSQVLGIWDASG